MFFTNQFDKNSPLFSRNPMYKINSEISVIEIGYNLVPPGLSQTLKRDVYILHYILKGKGVFMQQPFDSKCGYLVVPRELEVIHADDNDPYESYWIMFKGNKAGEILKDFNLKHNCVFSFERNNECIEIIKSALFKNDYCNELEEAYTLQAAFNKIISVHTKDINVKEHISNSVAYSVASYIEKNYYGQVRIDNVAQNFHMSRNHLYTLFKEEYGISPQEYLISLRIEKAKNLLRNGQINLSIKDVAYSVGFENPLYFSRLFHKRTGMTPSEFKKSDKLDPMLYNQWFQHITKKDDENI